MPRFFDNGGAEIGKVMIDNFNAQLNEIVSKLQAIAIDNKKTPNEIECFFGLIGFVYAFNPASILDTSVKALQSLSPKPF